ncbi:hypothetical protein [Amycolatopsis sp. CA-230715]|uniref:hypothetical protein n=1 Tax=Amycolatopsis sp. CA-230715 TaxID=2745196 RepID=UPI001C02DE54|nr:hypothetical protein [Amycolatopsis sp. CA-230715]QWF80308.1 hypothetical protein HUW46_03728 [Amycolatopsis sp. CA-230715]
MSWQEELRRLDADLASGKITQHQHRKQRDELLAAVSGGSAASPVVSPRQHSGQPVPPAPSQPVPPAHGQPPRRNQWQATNPAPTPPAPQEAPAPKPSHAQSLLSTDKPTTAPSPADVRRTESMPYPRPLEEPTVIHPAVRPPEPPRPPSQPTTPASPAATAANPFPMDDPAPSSRARAKPTWAFLAVGVLIVLGLIIGGTMWLSSSSDEQQPSAPPPAVGQDQATASLEDRLPPLPGTASPSNSTMALDKGLELKLFDKAALDAMKANGAREVVYRGSSDRTEGYMVLVVPTASAEGAANLVKALTAQSSSVGFQKSRTNADALARENDSGRVMASWYRSGDNVVGIGVSQTPQGEQAALAGKFGGVEKALTGVLPKN